MSKIITAILHPRTAVKYLSTKAIDYIFYIYPSFEDFLYVVLMNRKLPKALKHLGKSGYPVKIIYDIGARHGYWSDYVSRHHKAEFILFEANDEHEEALSRRGFQFFTGILSDEEKWVDWYGQLGTGDSYYKENTSFSDNIVPKKKKTQTLDGLIKNHNLPTPDLIKLDTQGSEIDILLGGGLALSAAKFVYIECSLVNYNDGAPQIADYINFMSSEGFIPYDLCEEHRKANALIQIDILFVKKEIYSLLDPKTKSLYY